MTAPEGGLLFGLLSSRWSYRHRSTAHPAPRGITSPAAALRTGTVAPGVGPLARQLALLVVVRTGAEVVPGGVGHIGVEGLAVIARNDVLLTMPVRRTKAAGRYHGRRGDR